MSRHGRRDRDCLDGRVGEDFVVVRRQPDRRIAATYLFERRGSCVARADDLRVVDLLEVPDEVGAPVAEPDDRDTDRPRAGVPILTIAMRLECREDRLTVGLRVPVRSVADVQLPVPIAVSMCMAIPIADEGVASAETRQARAHAVPACARTILSTVQTQNEPPAPMSCDSDEGTRPLRAHVGQNTKTVRAAGVLAIRGVIHRKNPCLSKPRDVN
jgi:hypothetical protein